MSILPPQCNCDFDFGIHEEPCPVHGVIGKKEWERLEKQNPMELAVLHSFVIMISKGECECGIPPNDNGVNCDTCQAIMLRDTFKF